MGYIHYTGVAVDTPSGQHTARAILFVCCADLPARAMLTNMKQWNGQFGCLYCEDEGTTLGTDHLHRYWPSHVSSTLRTHASILMNAEDATKEAKAVSMLYLKMYELYLVLIKECN